MLKDKYNDLLSLGAKLNVKNLSVKEEGGKLSITGTAPYELEKNLVWDKIKTFSNWENEIKADLKVEKTDIYGVYTVQPGDTLSKLAKGHLGDANRYMDIFNINKDVLKNPDMIKVGQNIKLPNK